MSLCDKCLWEGRHISNCETHSEKKAAKKAVAKKAEKPTKKEK